MRHAEVRAEIETRFAALWSATPVAYENVAFEPPGDGLPWVLLRLADDGAELASVGGPPRRWRCRGRVLLEIVTAAGTGSRAASLLADQALDLFAGWPASSLTFLAGAPGPAVQSGDGYRVTVTVPFRHDDLR
ncbi:MAG: phage tail terminator-like protein [Thalassobaculum sp.]|uniref:phage tail terminator-like protein n=1 Tax=Thalassobaculum sp. TaxID=2022740 RepID=UPI0032EC21AF